MANAFIEKLRGYAPLTAEDESLLALACKHAKDYPPDHDLIREGDEPGPVFVMLEGWAIRYKLLPGGERQIIAFLMPGDFCDMHVAVLAAMDHSIATLTQARVATIHRDQMESLTSARPTLARAFWWTQLVDEGVLRATIVSMGRRTSVERVAHVLCELHMRMRNVVVPGIDPCEMPFNQIVLADAVGLTAVHVNRGIRKLRTAGALDVRLGTMIIADLNRLVEIAGFDDNYLHRQTRGPSGPEG
jgi:CRP-like cAMP-binding protein